MAQQEKCAYPEKCPLAEDAADAAVKKVFAILGVDIDVPRDVETFRDNLRFGASLRRYADKSMLAIIGGISVLLLSALGAGLIKIIIGK